MRNILFITSRFPFPMIKGDQVVAFNRMKNLSENNGIILITFYENDSELKYLPVLEKYCFKIYAIKLTKFQSYFNIFIRFLFSNEPLQVLYYKSKNFEKILFKVLEENEIDIVHCCLLRMSGYLKKIKTPKVLELIDSMILNLHRRVKKESGIKKYIFKEEYARVIKYEKHQVELFDKTIVVAEADREYIGVRNVEVIPNGVDIDIFKPFNTKLKEYDLIFSGNMGYEPNINAVRWFIEECYPLLIDIIPNIKICIAGNNPSQYIKNLQNITGITVTGFVESIAVILNESKIAIAPMQSGSGMQNKILEAMACGLPVITSEIGLGSIKAEDKKEIFIAKDKHEFAKTIIKLLNDEYLLTEVGTKARLYVEEFHSWRKSNILVNNLYLLLNKDMGS